MKNFKQNFKSIVQRKARWLLTLLAILTLGVGQMWGEPWLCRSTNGGNIATKTVGDKLNNGNEWNYTYTTNGGWSSASDIQVLVGISTSSYTSVNADWVSDGDDGDNKNVAANIGNVTFDKSGKWYAVGKYTSSSTTVYTTTNNTWTSNTTLAFGSNGEPYWTVNPPAVASFTVSTTESDILSGTGTSSDPYIIAYNGSLVLTLSGSKNKTDVNSSLQYNTSGSWNTTTSRTISSITSTTKTSVTVKMRCYNSTASLSGTESTKTIYYQSEPSYTVTINNDGNGTTSPSGAQSNIGQSIGVAVSATASTNYEFVNWTITSGSGTFTGGGTTSTSASTRFYPTSAATIRANFRSTLVYSLTVSAGSGVNSVTGSNADVTLNTKYAITATPKTGYTFSSWTASPAANGTFDNANSASTDVTVKNGSVTVTANASEIMRTITINGGTAASTTAGVVTTGSATAAAPAEGKKFTGWTLGSGVTLSGGALTDRTINFTATENSSVTANYADRASVKLYFAKPTTLNWTKVYAYAWGPSGNNGDYPGVELSTTEVINCVTYYIYQYYTEADGIGGAATGDATWNKIVFGDNNDQRKTGDLNIANGHYYYRATEANTSGKDAAITSAWYIKGTMNSWGETDPITHNCATNSGSVNISLTTGTTWEFKVYNEVNDQMWSNSTACGQGDGITATMANAEILYNDDEKVMKITPALNGTYTFEVSSTNAANPKVKVTFPEVYAIVGSFNSWNTETNPLSMDGNTGTANIVLSPSATNYELKVVDDGAMYGKNSTTITGTTTVSSMAVGQSNIALKADIYPVSANPSYGFSYDKSAKALTVTYPAAHTVTYGVGTHAGTASVTSSISVASGEKILDSQSITFSKGALITGYTWKGWYNNEAGTGDALGTGDTYTSSSRADNTSVYACYNLVNYTITYNLNGGANPVSPAPATGFTIESSAITLPTPTRTGYTFAGWKVNSDLSGDSHTTIPVKSTGNKVYYAKWTPITYSITYHTNGGSEIPAGSYNIETATFALPTTSTKTGYTFAEWYTNSGLTGDPVVSITVGSYGDKEYWAKWTPNTYTLSFDVNGGTASTPDSRSVTYGSAYGALPTGMTHASKTFVGWYTDPAAGDKVTAETIVSTASNHTLYARYEDVYSVNVNFKCGDATVYPATSVNASPTSLAPTITAPEIFGYSFVSWTGSNVTPASPTSATTTITATAATTITANYEVVPTVYFKNNLGWDSVFVSFDITWTTADEKQVPVNNGKPYFAMTQIGSTDIYYCEIPNTYTSSNYANWSANIAFDNKNYNYKATAPAHTGNMESFYEGEFTGRGDFDPKATLYIPYNGDTEARNSGTFYASGCWMKYNSTESGYQVNMNTWVDGVHDDTLTVKLTAANAGGYEFSAKLNLKHANYSYGFKLYKIYQKNTTDLWYTNTGAISAATDDLPWHFWAGSTIDGTTQRCALHTEALGDYTITVSFATGKPMVNVEYPTSVGDWRLAYNDNIAWSSDAHDGSWYLYSRVIKAKTNAEDLVSFYVSKAADARAHVELQKCTAIDPSTATETWEKQGDDLDLSDITETGYYNFKVSQDEEKDATVSLLGAYSGNFYIRTDASDGGWSNYKSSKNLMTYSEFSDTNNKGFTHYFMRYVTSGSNIKFCVANDYSECLTEHCVNDDYTNEWIEANGNVRFMWNQKTNAVSRAYISGSSVVSDRFLVLEGDSKLFNEAGNSLTGVNQISGLNENEMKFTDDQNWIYEATIKAQPTARVKLTAKFNNQVQYFYGKAGEEGEERYEKNTYEIIGGSGSDKYKLRIVYDFKIDRLVSAFLPEGSISTDLAIHADMMIIRKHQEAANQVTFGLKEDESEEYGSLSDVKTVYGAMQFNKWTLNNKSEEEGHAIQSISASERGLYWISFPFDVNLSDVFGFGTYGRHWIIEEYNGAKRATDGYWADSDGFWEFVTNRSGKVLEAGKGYVLALDLDLLTESSDIWANNVENVYLYFPSSTTVDNIARTNVTVTVDPHLCSIDRTGDNGADINKNRTVADSHWNIIGVPSYANYGESLYSDEEGEHLITWQTAEAKSLPYLYQWNMGDNTYSVQSGSTYAFKSMHAYMVQYHGDIYWKLASATPVTPSVAARQTDVPDKEYMLSLIKDSVEEDHTYVRMSDKEGVTAGFEFGQDLCKEYNGNKGNIYTFIGYLPVAGNSQPHPLTTTIVPVGVKIAANGEYTFSMPEGTNGGDVWLIDNANSSRTNLGLMDYTVNLTTGTYEGRFSLEFPVQNVVTEIENAANANANANADVRKVFVGGRLYILRDGKAYDATGAQVR